MDSSDPSAAWWGIFPAKLTAKTGTSPILYTWEEQQPSASTGNYSTQEPARRGTLAREVDNRDMDVTGSPRVWMRVRGVVSGQVDYEFQAPSSGGSTTSYPSIIGCDSGFSSGNLSTSGFPKTEDDIIIACLTSIGGGAISPPAGWVALSSGTFDATKWYWIGYKVMTSSESTYTFTNATNAWCCEVTGCDIPDDMTVTGNSQYPVFVDPANVTPIPDGSVLVAFLAVVSTYPDAGIHTPSGISDVPYRGQGSSGIYVWTRHRFYGPRAASGDTGGTIQNIGVDLGSSQKWVASLVWLPSP